ncbi:sulfite exporter TauE/SafE family protein [Chelativorans sp. Marseille-P2723]|uniref:TSUP family transporter n=1 Tax=Chelativorans sp. Marseille-P2723 TaxID=2709133 RepID=UPI00156EB9FF
MIDTLWSWPGLAAAIALVLAGAIQGSTGFGFNMLAAPLLAILDPAFVPGPMITVATLVCIGGMMSELHALNRQDLAYALSGRVVSATVAALIVGLMSPEAFSALFGFAVLLSVGLSLSGLRIPARPSTLLAAGTISGFMGTLTSIGAPPMAMVYQDTGGARMRATLNAFFVFGGLISILALWLAGRFGTHDLWLAMLMTPFAFAGLLMSAWGRKFVDRGGVKAVVLTVSSISGLVLILRAFG